MPPAPMNSRTFRVDVRSQMTRRLARYIEQQSVHRTFTSVAGDVGVDEKTVRNLFRAYVERLDAETVFETPERMGIDEVHLLKKPRCVLTNLTERTIFGVLEKRDKKTVTAHLKSLPERETVKVVTMDMWRPYLDAVGETMPQAAVVVDKFHVVREGEEQPGVGGRTHQRKCLARCSPHAHAVARPRVTFSHPPTDAANGNAAARN